MKKFYSIIAAVAVSTFVFAQGQRNVAGAVHPRVPTSIHSTNPQVQTINDTLTNEFFGYPSLYSSAGGYVAGNNDYGDLQKQQLFNSTYGVTGAGQITGVCFWFGAKKLSTVNPSLTVNIWADNGGTPGAVLGTATLLYSAIDTSVSGAHLLTAPNATIIYNAVAMFPSGITIPNNLTFWAGITLNTTADTVGLVTTSDSTSGDAPGASGDFPDALTNTFEQESGPVYRSFNDGTNSSWELDVAMAIFPICQFASGVNELENNGIKLMQNMPNPTNGTSVINYSMKNNANVSLSIYNVTGSKVMEMNEGSQASGMHSITIDASQLPAGVYYYTLAAGETQLSKKMVVTH